MIYHFGDSYGGVKGEDCHYTFGVQPFIMEYVLNQCPELNN